MGSQLSLKCSACGKTSKFSVNRAQDNLACASCNQQFPDVQIERFEGCVYVLSNPSMPGLLKIGMTAQDAFDRARELSSATGVPEPYVVEAYIVCSDAASIELAAHQELAHVRKSNREFFAVSLEEALQVLEKLVGRKTDYRQQETEPHLVGRGPVKFRSVCSHCGRETWYVKGSYTSECSACKR